MNTNACPTTTERPTATSAVTIPEATISTAASTVTIAAVLFDMDGTLVDSDAAVARSWARWANLRDVPFAEVMRATPGRPASESMAELAPWLSPAERLADTEELLRRERVDLTDVVATPNAIDLVAALDEWAVPYAVVTSADETLARVRLEAAGLPVPKVLIAVSAVTRGKPHPEGFLTAASMLGIAPQSCLVVEDSPAGVRAGLAADAIVASVRADPAAHLQVEHLGHLHHRLSPTSPAGTLRLDLTVDCSPTHVS